jgi:hypothetical protein
VGSSSRSLEAKAFTFASNETSHLWQHPSTESARSHYELPKLVFASWVDRLEGAQDLRRALLATSDNVDLGIDAVFGEFESHRGANASRTTEADLSRTFRCAIGVHGGTNRHRSREALQIGIQRVSSRHIDGRR